MTEWKYTNGLCRTAYWSPTRAFCVSSRRPTAGWRQGVPMSSWYDLQLNGDIQGAPGPLFVHYIDFTIWPDGTTKPAAVDLSSHSFGAQQCPSTCSAIIPAVQLDGDSTPHPYDLFIDEAHIFWA